jgi:DNA repair protein RecO (recombination protein O)
MQWTDEGIILGTRRHGETSLIVELMTAGHGRHLGLVKGGRSPRHQAVLQPGNGVRATWRARLSEHLGNWTLEPVSSRAARLIGNPVGLYGVQLLSAHLRLLPERDPHPRLYTALAAILDDLADPLAAGELLVRFELELLNELGVGLDLSRCAATGATQDLAFVSPRTGRAVSRAASAPYADKLLALPGFLVARQPHAPPSAADLGTGFALTGYFLYRHVYEARGVEPPPARAGLIGLIERAGRLASANS